MKNPKLQGAGPKRKRRFGAAPFGDPRFISQKSVTPALCDCALASAPNNRVLAKCSLRLCASALKSTPSKRKAAKPQGINPTRVAA